LFRGTPEFEFVLRLPGELIETNGIILKISQTRWKFTSDQLFPDGYEMKARSIFIDRESACTDTGNNAWSGPPMRQNAPNGSTTRLSLRIVSWLAAWSDSGRKRCEISVTLRKNMIVF
jgi:hypothetical protein